MTGASESPAHSPSMPEQAPWLTGLVQDVRHACRHLRRQPGYAALTILTMALGVGATTTLFSLAYGVLYRPLPWADAGRIVRLFETRQGATRRFDAIMTNAAYAAWRDHPATIDGLAAWRVDPVLMNTGGDATRTRVAAATASLFPMLGVPPVLGRAYTETDEPGADGAPIVLSHGLWQERFGGRPDVLGRSLRVDGKPYRVVGVMPPAFAFPDGDTRAWRPMTVRFTKGGLSMFSAIARLKPGVTPAQAAAEGTARARGGPDPGPVVMAVFGSRAPAQITAVPWLEAQTAGVRPAILTFLAAVTLLMVAAVGNVAGLQLARGAARRREMAIRTALGGGGWRLIRQALAENLVIGLAGGVGGLCLAAALGRALPALLPATFPRLHDVRIDLLVATFAIGLSVLAGVASALLPAFQARRVQVVESLAEDGRGAGSGGGVGASRMRAAIISGQLAIACLLLVGAALFTRSFFSMLHLGPRLRPGPRAHRDPVAPWGPGRGRCGGYGAVRTARTAAGGARIHPGRAGDRAAPEGRRDARVVPAAHRSGWRDRSGPGSQPGGLPRVLRGHGHPPRRRQAVRRERHAHLEAGRRRQPCLRGQVPRLAVHRPQTVERRARERLVRKSSASSRMCATAA